MEDTTLAKPLSVKKLRIWSKQQNSGKSWAGAGFTPRGKHAGGRGRRELTFGWPRAFYAIRTYLDVRIDCEKFTNIWEKRERSSSRLEGGWEMRKAETEMQKGG